MELYIDSPTAKGWHTFSSTMSLNEFYSRLELITGIRASNQSINCFQKEYPLGTTLGSIVQNKQHLTILGTMEFDENVKKYEMSQELYAQREGTVQSFLKANKFGKYSENTDPIVNESISDYSEYKVGSRCYATIKSISKYGQIMYIGPFDLKPGQIFIGVAYDDPIGKHNGTIRDKVYFKCKKNHGALLRPHLVILHMPDGSSIPTADELFTMEMEEM